MDCNQQLMAYIVSTNLIRNFRKLLILTRYARLMAPGRTFRKKVRLSCVSFQHIRSMIHTIDGSWKNFSQEVQITIRLVSTH